MNIDSRTWGKHYWFVLHTISFTYPKNPNDTCKRKYYDLIQNLPLFLPNDNIANDFTKILNIYPVKPYLDSRASFVKWMHFIHNEVNRITGKEPLPYDTFIQIMNMKLTPPETPPPKSILCKENFIYIIFLTILCGLIYFEKKRHYI
tara:strand:- start:2434 stop:2874 length:441 start_codon:yes stop_codon:yes gene_type:complete